MYAYICIFPAFGCCSVVYLAVGNLVIPLHSTQVKQQGWLCLPAHVYDIRVRTFYLLAASFCFPSSVVIALQCCASAPRGGYMDRRSGRQSVCDTCLKTAPCRTVVEHTISIYLEAGFREERERDAVGCTFFALICIHVFECHTACRCAWGFYPLYNFKIQ
ncbi:hypothetical protein QBC46DRAFT_1224 [Diplogelasinospora grovesii]|uniref:Uncharacterized protein n=1 Tax=Diplogelasinospora grovesii TaxID=303347 RepID=A0AAN6NII2_9PEZI|nr:hypothetical protein QBC46DRAFT_1224 [Diplogelasinospora grovesii]